MPAKNGRSDPLANVVLASAGSAIARLLAEPQRFQFFQAVHLLQAWLAERGVVAERALVDYLRFDNSISLGFPASQIEALTIETPPADSDAQAEALPRFHVTAPFMGFLGSHGVLPAHYSERIAAWQYSERDDSPRAFLDMFSTRVLTLFYLGWRKYRVEHNSDGGDGGDGGNGGNGGDGGNDDFLAQLLALTGRRYAGDGVGEGEGAGNGVGNHSAQTIAWYAGLLQQRPVPPVAIARLLSDYFGLPFRVEESVGHMSAMTLQEQTSLSGPQALLGDRAMLGERSWRPDLRARLLIGPMTRPQFARFLPGGDGAAAIASLLPLFGSAGIVVEIRLLLRAQAVSGIRLDTASARLGWDSFLLCGAQKVERSDVAYELRTMAPFPEKRAAPI